MGWETPACGASPTSLGSWAVAPGSARPQNLTGAHADARQHPRPVGSGRLKEEARFWLGWRRRGPRSPDLKPPTPSPSQGSCEGRFPFYSQPLSGRGRCAGHLLGLCLSSHGAGLGQPAPPGVRLSVQPQSGSCFPEVCEAPEALDLETHREVGRRPHPGCRHPQRSPLNPEKRQWHIFPRLRRAGLAHGQELICRGVRSGA